MKRAPARITAGEVSSRRSTATRDPSLHPIDEPNTSVSGLTTGNGISYHLRGGRRGRPIAGSLFGFYPHQQTRLA